nr:MAG TPA: hypothetical protein [Caudoviricetes sp.]
MTNIYNSCRYPCGECQTPHASHTKDIKQARELCGSYNRCTKWLNWFKVEWSLIRLLSDKRIMKRRK